jgi:hypothetical protein
MADWTRVWGNTSECCPSSCYNFVTPQDNCNGSASSAQASILDGLTTNVNTCAEAVNVYAQQLKQRLGAQSVIVASLSDALFTLSIRMRRKRYITTLAPSSGCKYPVVATCVVGTNSYSSYFQSMTQVIDWWVENLK